MPSGPIDSTAGLMAALKVAQGGETILLAPGVYDGFGLRNVTYADGVTIASADPAHPAVLTDFSISNVHGLTFSHLEFATLDHPDLVAQSASFFAFKVAKSSDISFDHVSIHGSLDGDSTNDVYGLQIRDSNNIAVTNSEFQQLGRGLAIGQTQDLVVSGNHVHDVRSDGFDFAEVARFKLTNNTLRNFSPVAGDHPDAIQFWTSGTTTPSHDILISGNVILRGTGQYTQGIFLRDQIGTLHYENVTISDNLIVGTGYSGIRIQGAKNMTISNNELVTFAGDNKTFVLVQNSDGITATDNSATSISFDHVTGLVEHNNAKTSPVGDHGAGALQKWVQTHALDPAQQAALLPIAYDDPGGSFGSFNYAVDTSGLFGSEGVIFI